VGRGHSAHTNTEFRSDGIFWIEAGGDAADTSAMQFARTLLSALNAQLFLGLDHAELHYALYPPGGRYGKHLDRHRDSDARILSFVVYLNESWKTQWGGQLQLYTMDDTPLTRVEPEAGTMVLFRSELFPHEVLASSQNRASLTGWLRRR
jgi:SM-20-related protein